MRNILLATTNLTALAYSTGEQGTTVTLPVGRIVWGHPSKPRQKIDQDTKQPKRDAAGNVIMETSFGLAIPIAEFQAQVWPVMAAEAAKGYPNGAPGKFSWKMTQPTEIDPQGKPYSEREGYDGHIVLAVSTTLEPPAVFQWDGARWNQMQVDALKCGDYVQAEINFKVNVPTNATHKPSLFVNPRQLAFVGYGEEIKGGFNADPNAAFGSGPAALPPGASATPVASAGTPGMPGAPGNDAAGAGSQAPMMPNAGTAAPGANAMPMQQPSAMGGMPGQGGTPPSPVPPAPTGPQRPTDPTHVHDNGNGTEQWFVNGAWDGGAHPVAAPATLPPPATGFVAQAAGMPAAPGGAPAMPGAMPPR